VQTLLGGACGTWAERVALLYVTLAKAVHLEAVQLSGFWRDSAAMAVAPGDTLVTHCATQMKGKGSIKVDAGDTGSIRAGYDQTYEVSDNPPEAELTGSYGGNRYWTTSAAAY